MADQPQTDQGLPYRIFDGTFDSIIKISMKSSRNLQLFTFSNEIVRTVLKKGRKF